MLNENERQELKEKNLNLIDNWVKEFCSDGGYYKIEHAFRSNGKDFRISASKKVSVLRPTGNTPSGAMSVGCITIWRQ